MRARKADLVGRRVVRVDWRKFDSCRAGKKTPGSLDSRDPVLTLDNGRRVWFVVDETDSGEYGIDICITNPIPGEKTK